MSDWLLKKGVSVNVARKLPVVVGLLMTSTIVLANFTTNIPLVLTILSIASFAQGLSNISWTMLSEVAPREMVGLAGGVFNFFANLAGIITPFDYRIHRVGDRLLQWRNFIRQFSRFRRGIVVHFYRR